MAYTDTGIGTDTILFIHGLGAWHGTWQKNVESLSLHTRCIAIDLPGNGCSSAERYDYSIDFFARCIIHFIYELGLQRVTLAGHSMGGQIALRTALLAPLSVHGLILCAPAGFETFSPAESFLYKNALSYASWMGSDDVYMRQLIHASFFRFSPDAEQIIQGMQRIMQKQPPGHYRHLVDRCISAMLEEPIFAELRQIHQAALILFGEEDALIPNKLLHQTSTARIAATGAAEMSHASLHMIPQAGHFVQWEAAETVNAYIGHWLRAAADGH